MNQKFTVETIGISWGVFMYTPAGKEKIASSHFESPCKYVAKALQELTDTEQVRARDRIISALKRGNVSLDQAANLLRA